MTQYLVKLLATALVVVLASEVAKRSTWWGALIVALPMTSLLAMFWLYRDTGDATQVAKLARDIFWLVLPSLALFLVLPWAIERGWGFWRGMALGCAATVLGYGALAWAMKRLA